MKRLLLSNAAVLAPEVAGVLRRSGFVVHGVDLMPAAGRLWSRHLESFTFVRAAEADRFCEEIEDLAERLSVDGFLPIGSRFAYAAMRLGRRGPEREAFWEAATKSRCLEVCRELGIPAPASYGWAEARAVEGTLVVKPDWDVGAAVGVRYVRGEQELDAAVAACRRDYGDAVIQEYVPGGTEAMRTLTVVCGEGGEVVAAATMRKWRQKPETGGVTMVGESTHEPALLEQMRPLFRRWRWRGAAEVEVKVDARDGSYRVIEVNPRWPGYVGFLGEIYPGLVVAAARLAVGEEVRAERYPAYEAGRWHTRAAGLGREAWRWPGAVVRGAAKTLADPLPVLNRIWQGKSWEYPLFPVRPGSQVPQKVR